MTVSAMSPRKLAELCNEGKKIDLIDVRIAAGLMIVTASALGYFVHPAWIGLAAFVGAGLTFAGVTDTCGMGMLLARMPWNQVAATSHTSAAAGSKPSDAKQCPPQSNSSLPSRVG